MNLDYSGFWLGSHGDAAERVLKVGVAYRRLH
jgi:hypothetical protein